MVIHQQRTRRGGTSDGESYFRFTIARQIRSIDGTDGSLGFRLAVSADFNSLPPGMADPMGRHEPVLDDRDTPNSYRDPR